jgi:hypothetical protein
MHNILLFLVHSIVTIVRLMKPGGLHAVVAESALTRHQLLILNRSRKRAPNLRFRSHDRRFMHPSYAPISYAALRYCPKAIHAAAFPPRTGRSGSCSKPLRPTSTEAPLESERAEHLPGCTAPLPALASPVLHAPSPCDHARDAMDNKYLVVSQYGCPVCRLLSPGKKSPRQEQRCALPRPCSA